MQKIKFIVILIFLLFIVNFYVILEPFDICHRFDKCSKYDNKSYSQCYNSGECSVMIDLIGNTFCTNKII
jgi:hypothetical protein